MHSRMVSRLAPPVHGRISLHLLPGSIDIDGFADRLWGDIYFDPRRRKFTRKQNDPEDKRSFVHFVLEPLYKLYSQVSLSTPYLLQS